MACVIEEIDDQDTHSVSTSSSDSTLEQLLQAHGQDGKAFLAAVFDFLQSKTGFFAKPEVSKVLARLLKDVKDKHLPKAQPKATPNGLAQSAHTPHASAEARAGPSIPQQPPPSTAPSGEAKGRIENSDPADQAASSSAEAEASATAEKQESAAEEDAKKDLLKPNAGNGADLESYSWTQTLSEVVISVPMPPKTRGKDCTVSVTKTGLTVGLVGHPAVLSGDLLHDVKADDTLWNVDSRALEITLQKREGMTWWKSVLKGEKEIDTQKVEPENSKLSDLDGDTRATVEKMMWDQRQKQLGLPTSKEAEQQEMLQKFMKAHPEMDFSKAKFS